MGFDHRTPSAKLNLETATAKITKKSGKRTVKVLGWTPSDSEIYKRTLDAKLEDAVRSEELEGANDSGQIQFIGGSRSRNCVFVQEGRLPTT